MAGDLYLYVVSDGRTLRPYGAVDAAALADFPCGVPMKVTPKPNVRTDDQNRRMWAMIRDVARARPEGRDWPQETWKAALLHAFGHEIFWQPGLEGAPPFPAGFRSSRMTKQAMSEFQEFVAAYGDRHGVVWTDPKLRASDAA